MRSARVGKRGAIIVPANLRKRFGIDAGTMVTAEENHQRRLSTLAQTHFREASQRQLP